MEAFLEIAGVILVAATKFLFSAKAALFANLSIAECMLTIIFGGWLGILVFFNSANQLMRRTARKQREKLERALASGKPVKQKKKFTWINKTIVKTKAKFGMVGLAIITPAMLSIPIGSIVCAKFYQKQSGKMLSMLLLSVVIWAVVLSPLWYYVIPI